MQRSRQIVSLLYPPILAILLVVLLRLSVFSVVRVVLPSDASGGETGRLAFVTRYGNCSVGRTVVYQLTDSVAQIDALALGRIDSVRQDSSRAEGTSMYWVLADDTLCRPDSRDHGWISERQLQGVVWFYLPFF